MRRALVALGFAFLLGIALREAASQSAVSHSRPGQEDLTFWVHRRGLEQIDVEGEVGFGDMARILLRRRENATRIAEIRDRFTFRTLDLMKLETPDSVRIEIHDDGLRWVNRPERFVAAAGRVFNVPVIIANRTSGEASVAVGALQRQMIPARQSSAYFLKFRQENAGQAKWPLLVEAGASRLATQIEFDVRPLVNLRVRLLDEGGLPVAARVYVTGSDGLAYAPRGSMPRITAMSAEYYFHSDGGFSLDLPAGPARIEATRGQEYEMAATLVDLLPGRPAEASLRLRRWTHAAARGWYSADSHIHANYVAPHHQVMTPEDMRLIAAAEDLNNSNLLVANSGGDFIHDRQYFEGRPHALSTPNYILFWNEEFRSAGMYGHIAFFQLKSLIEPFYTGFRNTPHADDYPPNYTAAKAAKDQGGAVTYVHPGMSHGLDVASLGAGAKELPVDLALGVIDAMDVISNNDEMAGMQLWHRLLNCGFRIAISAGTDSFTNVSDHYTPGGGRVYVHLNGPLRYGDWVDRYRKGYSFASNGPMIELQVDGKEPGDEIRLAGPAKVRVSAKVTTQVPLDRLEVVMNGVSVMTRNGVARGELAVSGELPVNGGAWIAARALGPRHRLIVNDWGAFAHTSPVYVTLDGKPAARREDAQFFLSWIDRLTEMVETRGRFSTPERKREVLELFQRAAGVYRKIAAN
ncbi:MAG: CehA/McbA family metallohydrolase [Acidobacteria bacterium]|nr:CehA/McbA family metallohydrolase [Acidobacteriota bacterium]